MTLHSSRQSLVLELVGGDLFIRVGSYELSWNGHGLFTDSDVAEVSCRRRIERGWVWREVAYERLASGACNG